MIENNRKYKTNNEDGTVTIEYDYQDSRRGWTKIFNDTLEKILPVKHVMREPGIPVELGSGKRLWKADYTFSLAGRPYVVEVKIGEGDKPLDGMKVVAYRKLYNLHTEQDRYSLIVSRQSNSNSADLLACGLIKVSLLTIDFKEQLDKSILFTARLDGSIKYQSVLESGKWNTHLKTQDRRLLGPS